MPKTKKKRTGPNVAIAAQWKAKAVIFDFDGTLTQAEPTRTAGGPLARGPSPRSAPGRSRRPSPSLTPPHERRTDLHHGLLDAGT